MLSSLLSAVGFCSRLSRYDGSFDCRTCWHGKDLNIQAKKSCRALQRLPNACPREFSRAILEMVHLWVQCTNRGVRFPVRARGSLHSCIGELAQSLPRITLKAFSPSIPGLRLALEKALGVEAQFNRLPGRIRCVFVLRGIRTQISRLWHGEVCTGPHGKARLAPPCAFFPEALRAAGLEPSHSEWTASRCKPRL